MSIVGTVLSGLNREVVSLQHTHTNQTLKNNDRSNYKKMHAPEI